MPQMRARIIFCQLFALLFIASGSARGGIISTWNAASGLTPDQISPAWTVTDTAAPEVPVLAPGVLTLTTSEFAENMGYLQSGSMLDTTTSFYIETRLQYVSGATTAASRAPITITFNTGGTSGNSLFIGKDEVFFNTGNSSAGIKAAVDTDGSLHTYRINYDGLGNLALLYDSNQILTGKTFNDVAFNGSVERIGWGELSILANGQSKWTSFEHNALVATPVPEPSTGVLIGIGSVVLFGWIRRRR